MGSAHSSRSSLEQGPESVGGNTSCTAIPDDSNSSIHSNGHDSLLSRQQLSEQHSSYTQPSSPIQPLAHYIFLVHGYMGNDLEFAYLSHAFREIISPDGVCDSMDVPDVVYDSLGIPESKRRRSSGGDQPQQTSSEWSTEEDVTGAKIIVHGVKCNVGKTHDGIRNGGIRLANEVIDFIKSDAQKRIDAGEEGVTGGNVETDAHANHAVTFSLIGNSLGGLYSRYALSLIPYQLKLQDATLHMHPNIFCTTATPHLGISRHTYLPIPRIAEKIIGTGMGETGRDLFRLNSEKDLSAAAAGNIMNAAVGSVRRLSSLHLKNCADGADNGDTSGPIVDNNIDEEEMQCVIRNMCLQDKYLNPLRNFRQRVAYANVYGTDFQVPTETAAFLNEKSGVGHFVVASRDLPPTDGRKEEEGGGDAMAEKDSSERNAEAKHTGREQIIVNGAEGKEEVPSFIVAIVRTQQQSQPQSPTTLEDDNATPDDELLRMSQSLDALGWTKVFIDVQDRIPAPRLAKPVWMRPPGGSLDSLIRERAGLPLQPTDMNDESATSNGTPVNASKSAPNVQTEQLILTSQELVISTVGDSINFPMGHGVMVANSKNVKYSQANSQGRPVMDRLAKDMVRDVMEYE